ncbi:MAG: L,D-transpeptidase family protein [Rickettsia sp.]|jgi:L,D-peptidoglycan transpeptidase YkuD (ErfK/YbiS/YcfS/YnhG family)|nr:L,D-transpeptidase family protein [Rickettsia sp.]
MTQNIISSFIKIALAFFMVYTNCAYAITLNVCYKDKICTMNANGKVYSCMVGKNGVIDKKDKREGDDMTPTGTYKLVKAYYRADRLSQDIIDKIAVPKQEINPWSLWGDDPKDPKTYNTYVDARNYPDDKPNFDVEHLMRTDGLYDLLYVIDYNLYKIGSAIFLHINDHPTAGCVGLKRDDLFELVPQITNGSEITISLDNCPFSNQQ